MNDREQSVEVAPAQTTLPKVLINLCWLVPGVVGGSEESTTDALRAIAASGQKEFDIELAVLKPFLNAHPDLAEAFTTHVVPLARGRKVTRVLMEQTWLARLATRRRADLVHHAGGVVPLVHQERVVLTIHDLQPLELPQNFKTTKRLYMKAMLGRSARSATVICAPSEFTARRVHDLLRIDSSRVIHVPWSTSQTVRNARSRRARTARENGSADSLTPLYPGWTPERRFIIYPSITYPHKRHGLLLAAFEQIADRLPDVDLVLTGGPGPVEEDVLAAIEASPHGDRVKRLGRVPDDELERLYASAALMAMPSAYEGFGLPVVESLSRGVLILASRAGAIPELLPDTWMVRDESPESWARAMIEVLSLNGNEVHYRCEQGRRIAASFSPRRTAAALLDAYRLAMIDEGARR